MPLLKRRSSPHTQTDQLCQSQNSIPVNEVIIQQGTINSPASTLHAPTPIYDGDSSDVMLSSFNTNDVTENNNLPTDMNMNINIIGDTDNTGSNPKVKYKGIIKPILGSNFSFYQNFTVFNLFSDFARYIGLKSRKKAVHFPAEVIQAAEVKGETSPDGNIPLTNFPYRANYSQKKSKVVRVTRGAEFKPRLAWIEDTSKCEVRCERLITSCNCIGEYQDPKIVLKEKAKKKKHKDTTPKLTKLTESFMYHVNIADFFLIGHKTRTLTSALEDVDGINPTRAGDVGLRKESLLKTPSGDQQENLEESKKSGTELYEYTDELPTLSQSKLGKLATNVWIFGSCIPFLFTSDDTPTEASYRKLMGHFAGLAMSANEAARDLIQQSKDFHNYAFESMRVIRALQIKIFLQGETSVKNPLSMGSGLQILRKSNLSTRPPFEILVAKLTSFNEPLQFKAFEELGSTQKLNALRNLATSTLVEFDHAKHQIDFLVDDIKETTYDSKNDTDLLYRLSEMYNCITNISAKSQSNPTERSTAELKVICETMSKFVMSLNSFINASEHVMEKIMEVRDIVQLTYIYLQEEVKIDLSKLMPPDTPIRIESKMGVSSTNKHFAFCCRKTGGPQRKKHVKKELRAPHYHGSDFFRVFYEDSFQAGDTIVDGYVFRVRPSARPGNELKSRDYPQIKFRHSEPNVFMGRGSASSIDSSDSLPGNSATNNSGGGGLTSVTLEEAPLKPILKESISVPPPSPGAAHVSPIVSIEGVQTLTRSKSLEIDDDEPVLERKGKDSVILKKDSGSKKGSGGSSGSGGKL